MLNLTFMAKGKCIFVPVYVMKAFMRRKGRAPLILNLSNTRHFFNSKGESERVLKQNVLVYFKTLLFISQDNVKQITPYIAQDGWLAVCDGKWHHVWWILVKKSNPTDHDIDDNSVFPCLSPVTFPSSYLWRMSTNALVSNESNDAAVSTNIRVNRMAWLVYTAGCA